MCLLVAVLASLALQADGAAEQPKGVPPAKEPPKTYKARHVAKPPGLDGTLDDAAWAEATWSDAYVDIEGNAKPTPRYATRMKMVWDQTHLYIAAEMEEPDVWATYRTHDQIVFHENDFEVFIDPNGDGKAYYELEVNCLGTIFDLYLHRMYREGGPAFHRWNCKGLKTAIAIQGTANDPRDVDSGWTLEWAIPFASLTPPRTEVETDAAEAKRAGAAPAPGESWRINFSRVQWQHNYEELDASGKRIGPKRPDARSGGAAPGDVPKYVKTPNVPENNWVWSPQGVIDMHLPDRWGFVTFVRE